MSTQLFRIVGVILLSRFIDKCLTASQTVTMSNVGIFATTACPLPAGCTYAITVCKFSDPPEPHSDCQTQTTMLNVGDSFTSLTFPPLTLTQAFPCPFDCKMQASMSGAIITAASTITNTRVSLSSTVTEVLVMPFVGNPFNSASVTLTSVVDCPVPATPAPVTPDNPIPIGEESPENEDDESAEGESANDADLSPGSLEAETPGDKRKRHDFASYHNMLKNMKRR